MLFKLNLSRTHLVLTTALILSSTSLSWAKSQLNNQCVLNQKTQQLSGVQTSKAFTLASVSKIFTTYWALKQLGPQYRFPHQIWITAVQRDLYDIHIAGSQFPFFDRTMFQFMIAQLNLMGINQINTLTFDENFEYSSLIRTDSTLAHQNHDPTPNEIMKDLRFDAKNITTGFTALKAKSAALDQTNWPSQIKISIGDIHFVSSTEFQASSSSKKVMLSSAPLYRVLKEMNRNSNNFVADKIFEKLSQAQTFQNFMSAQFGMTKDDIELLNGSGYPIEDTQSKFYNSGSCSAVTQVLSKMTELLNKNNLGLHDVLSVAGLDSPADGKSTVSLMYSSSMTEKTLVGKTGTVATTVTLAGLLLTQSGNLFFHTSYAVNDNINDRNQARNSIKQWIESLIAKNGKKALDSYQPKSFLPFDHISEIRTSPFTSVITGRF